MLLFKMQSTTFLLILNYYLLINRFIVNKERDSLSYVMEFRSYCFILSVGYTMIKVEDLLEPVSISEMYLG